MTRFVVLMAVLFIAIVTGALWVSHLDTNASPVLKMPGQFQPERQRHLFEGGFDHRTLVLRVVARGTTVESFSLTVIARNVRNAKGVIGVLVFSSSAGWPENVSAAFSAQSVPAHPDVSEVVIRDLPAADYAVVVLHDENENQRLDRNALGVPLEQWGMSNNPPYLFAPPSFDAALFHHTQDQRLNIDLH